MRASLWTAAEAAAATGGEATGDWQANGISIDSRSVQPGDLFVALSAARDGHDFVADALDKGAVAALVSRVPAGVDPARLLIVPDVLEGLAALGRAARARTKARVIAVTGSVGKTTVKEMLRAALSPQGATHAAEASFNNHWGVPVTLARMPADTDFAIIEIGMNAPGEIAPLARMAAPDVAIVTTVAPAHLEAFGVIEGIAHEKASIYEGLPAGGIALAHADVETAPILFDKARSVGAELIRFGEAEEAEMRLTEVRLSDTSTVVRARMRGDERLFKLAVPGRHHAMNALIALSACDVVGADVAEAALALSRWEPVSGRGTREALDLSGTGDLTIELIDDAFNANPASLAAGLDVLAAAEPQGRGRRIAVLGDMLELGTSAPEIHAEVADLPAMARVDMVHTAGPLMEHLHAALPASRRGLHAETAAELARLLPRELRAGDVVLVKGSKGSRVSGVVDALRKLGQATPTKPRGSS
ncbi:UDP-N-acetylmuramoyl-tripeptide--D-alanyl-D-alanine ligase [Roseibacterium sp. SDUM158016]|uniref:UDP-N-acetylmuramoyl-tripeptide--D-alanyl-D- alanine ligase n=1 Tax=Roseicyclus sediminis TaxID=2980997 RepID=UPI0021D3E69C|nr:UDP-N-acetylmuramoyl-tripeptide--D-alanyl-D-alanine ligase [Roseibacterium sp. SDUM158016]MCU4652872.1 UDP-N-acetylmuramoyl-tripeptide--D-alanyl-D-alanine ligase [Roseibacterium sp. SDUM158016]